MSLATVRTLKEQNQHSESPLFFFWGFFFLFKYSSNFFFAIRHFVWERRSRAPVDFEALGLRHPNVSVNFICKWFWKWFYIWNIYIAMIVFMQTPAAILKS